MTELCEVCGELVDEWGCIGEFRGKHVPIEMAKLRARIAELEAELERVRKEREPSDP